MSAGSPTPEEKVDRRLAKALKDEIAVYRRDEQECFAVCGPSETPGSRPEIEAQTHGQVAANHADRLELLLAEADDA